MYPESGVCSVEVISITLEPRRAVGVERRSTASMPIISSRVVDGFQSNFIMASMTRHDMQRLVMYPAASPERFETVKAADGRLVHSYVLNEIADRRVVSDSPRDLRC